MQFIKNKTTNQSKLLLTSSVLILNGNMCGLVNSKPKPIQQLLKQTTTNSRSMMETEKDGRIKETKEDGGIEEILNDLRGAYSKLEKFKKQLPTQNLMHYEAYNKGNESGYESGDESETEREPIYEEINYGKIDPYKNKKQAYTNHTKEHYNQGYSSGSDSAYHTDTDPKDGGRKSDNGNDSNGHTYETIPHITKDNQTNGKQNSDTNVYYQIYSSDNKTEEPIYEELGGPKDDGQPLTGNNIYDSVYEPGNAAANEPNHEPTNGTTTRIISNKEATKEIKIMEMLAFHPDEADKLHDYIPEIKAYKLIENLQLIVSTMNRIARARKEQEKENLLTEEQKEQFRYLKLNIKKTGSPSYDVIKLYNDIHSALNNPIELTKKDKKGWCNQAKEIQKKLNKILKDVEKLRSTIPPDMMGLLKILCKMFFCCYLLIT